MDAKGQAGAINRLHLVSEAGEWLFRRDRGELIGAQDVPRLGRDKVTFDEGLLEEMCSGFESGYEVLLRYRSQLSELVEVFRNDTIRVLFRHTAAYTHLLDEATHPLLLRSQDARQKHFSGLRLGIAVYPAAERFVDIEIADLERGDVPLFTTSPESLDLFYSQAGRVSDFFECSGLEAVRSKIAMLSHEDLRRQMWILRSAFGFAGKPAPQIRPQADVRAATDGVDELPRRLFSAAEMLATASSERCI